MQCESCEQTRKDFICSNCLRSNVLAHQARLSHFTSERDALVKAASEAINGPLYVARAKRADIALLISRVEEIQTHVGKMRKENEAARERLAQYRASIATRRETLSRAYTIAHIPNPHDSPARTPTPTPPGGPPRRASFHSPTPSETWHARLDKLTDDNGTLQEALAKARQGLVAELVDVFDLAEVGGRPSLGVRAGTRGEWTIVGPGLVFPVPGDIRRYTPMHINAILTHTIHFLGLLTFYLGIKLPFQITWSGGKLGVGQPSISAMKPPGTETGGWAKWLEGNPLHLPMSNSTGQASATPSPPSSPVVARRSVSSSSVLPSLPSRQIQSASKILPLSIKPIDINSDANSFMQQDGEAEQTPASFTTALAMLLYDVAYLAWTQGVDIPLAQTGEVLRNLWAVCCSAELGKLSHETHPPLPPPTPPNFPLDFKQLLQATSADPASRIRPRVRSHRTSTRGGKSQRSKQTDMINEEDEWEVVDDT